jgi:hypothetical protein
VTCRLLPPNPRTGLVHARVALAGPASGVPVPLVALPPERPKASQPVQVLLCSSPSTAAQPGYRRTAPPNPSLESGPSEAGHLAREPAQSYSLSPGQGALPLRAAQLKR